MAHPERVHLSSIGSLTLYADEPTRARRVAPVPQLECTGKICRDYQPAAVHCTNTGGPNIDIDWKCEADLPSSMRFGKLQVSCEGWDRPGDPYVLKGSCGLTYSLVRIPHNGVSTTDYSTYLLYVAAFLLALYFFITWLSPRLSGRSASTTRPNGGGGGGWGSATGRGGRGGGPNSSNAPPPYSKYPPSQNPSQSQSWAPGFWTGLGAGGLAAGMYHYLTRPRETYAYRPAAAPWDWERPGLSSTGAYRPEPSAGRRRDDNGSSWGAGSSTGPGTRLGEMRRATGYASTSVR